MTIFVEVSRPWMWRPGFYSHRTMWRVWWGPVAIGVLRVPFHEFATTAYDWSAM